MRFVLRAMCVVALAGCSDVKAPVEPKSSAPANPVDKGPQAERPRPSIDPRSISERLEELFGQRLSKVTLPADPFSLSPDAVHPDVACSTESWNGAQCWLMYTPYKNSDPSYENPAFLAAGSDTAWTTPSQVLNPVIEYPGQGQYNSDPDHAFDPATGRLIQMYRLVADSMNRIMIMSTANARQWTTPVVAFKERNHDAVSPSLLIDDDRRAKVWYVRAGAEGCLARSTTVLMRTSHPDNGVGFEQANWSAPTPVDLTVPGAVVWHLDVIDVPGGLRCANGSKMLTARTSPWWYPAALRCSRFAPLYWSGLLQRQNRNAEDIAARSSRRLTGNISHRIVAPGSLPGIAALF